VVVVVAAEAPQHGCGGRESKTAKRERERDEREVAAREGERALRMTLRERKKKKKKRHCEGTRGRRRRSKGEELNRGHASGEEWEPYKKGIQTRLLVGTAFVSSCKIN